MEQKREESIVYEQTYQVFELQLSVVEKAVTSQLWLGKKHFPSILVYEICRFVFRNPIRLKETLYAPWPERILKVGEKLLVKCNKLESIVNDQNASIDVKSDKNREKSAFFIIAKQWRALNANDCSYAQVISKGKLFLSFLSNIKLKLHPDEAVQLDPLNDYNAFQQQQKDKNKYYSLISDNLIIVFKQFEEILQYEKDKKISDILIKSFINLMSKNIAVVRIEENYYTATLGCEGRYLYVENNSQLPFIKNQHRALPTNQLANKIADFPWIQLNRNGDWKISHNKHAGSVYKEQSFPLRRQRRWMINKRLEYYLQEDVWVSKL